MLSRANKIATRPPQKPILGRDTALKLDVLRIGKPEKPEVNAVSENPFKGIGKLKDYKLKLHINPEVKPVAQPVHSDQKWRKRSKNSWNSTLLNQYRGRLLVLVELW